MKELKFVIKAGEEKVIPFVWINGDETEVLISVKLLGNNSTAKIVGLFYGTGNSSIVFNTHVTHKGQRTKSLTTIRGVFKNHATFNNDGMIHIAKGAKGADGYFASKILLFDDSKGRSVPSLEIDENDLKAGHASTIGRPDENQMFYLRSRGLSEQEAEKLIIRGFFNPLILQLPGVEQVVVKKQLDHILA